MRKRWLLVTLLVMSSGAPAVTVHAEWVLVGSTNNEMWYVDSDTIRRNGNSVKWWELIDFKTAQTNPSTTPHLSVKIQKEIRSI